MSESNGDWKLQASIKFGAHLFNVRAGDWAAFAELLRGVTNNAPEILAAAAALERQPAPPAAVQAPPSPAVQAVQAVFPGSTVTTTNAPQPGETLLTIGSVRVEPFQSKAGVDMTRYHVTFTNGVTAATVNEKTSHFCQASIGRAVYAILVTGKFGTDLKAVRAA